MPSELKVIELSNDVTVGTFRNAILVHFRRQTPEQSLTAVRTAASSLARLPARRVFFCVIEVASVPPDATVRTAFTRMFEELDQQLSCAIVVVRGEGFRAAMVRTIVSGILNLSPKFRFSFARHVVNSVEKGATLALTHSPGFDTLAFREAFRELAEMKPEGRGAR